MRPSSLALLACLLTGGPSLAEAESAATEPVEGEPTETEEEPASARVDTEDRRKLPCGCAKSRLLRRGRVAAFGDGHSVSAWIDEGRHGTQLQTFAADFFKRKASAPRDRAIPVEERTFERPGLASSKHRLVRVHLGGQEGDPIPEPFYLGILREADSVPKDVVEVTPLGGPGAPVERVPALEQLWLDAMDVVDREACGPAFATTRVAFELAEGSPEVAGFLVGFEGKTVDGADEVKAEALVDVRHARSFGIGRPERCDHGLDIPRGATGELTLRPVSASFGVGPAWTFTVDHGTEPPPAASRPDEAGPAAENPFLAGAAGEKGRLGDESDKAALGAMVGVVGAAGTLAAILWPALRRRRKKIETIRCPACDAEHELDLRDPKTDGMFCPSCGRSSIYVSTDGTGEPRATVLLLGADDNKDA